jgi:hypothetical protein
MYYVDRWAVAWTSLIDGVFSVITLGIWWPNLSINTAVWASLRQLNRVERTKS